MGACLGRLGSHYSIIFDPHKKQIEYGALGLMRQAVGQMVIGQEDRKGNYCTLPFTTEGDRFRIVDQTQTMTSLTYEAYSSNHGTKLTVRFVSPFWPQDERTSLVPAYIVKLRLESTNLVRWTHIPKGTTRRGKLRFGLKIPRVKITPHCKGLRLDYKVDVGGKVTTGEGGATREISAATRCVPTTGHATDLIVPLDGNWRVKDGRLEAGYTLADGETQELTLAMVGYCGDALFERFGKALKMKYASFWPSADAVADYVAANSAGLCRKSAAFDRIWSDSSFPGAVQDLSALSFQSYLMNTCWAVGPGRTVWFGVAEGSCGHLSTVDVAYNEAMLYFACWPGLMEILFQEWSHHANNADDDRARRAIVSDDERFGVGEEEFNFPGRIMQHDMGSMWTANGMSYHHMMPVEENSNWLLMLYAHGKWWKREGIYKTYNDLNKELVEYLLWTDSTGTAFPDRGVANTIDDATPAVQYGRDNIYLGIKRLAALHAARRMFETTGETKWARRCSAEVRRAVAALNKHWLGDHWGVCLDKSAKGLIDCWSRKPLPYRILPGWDAYSLYTTNGLLYLLMVDDLPPGLSADRLRRDAENAARASMTRYGCGHSSLDKENMWVSMNVWRDCAAGYLGLDMLENSERYWAQQVFGNGPGAEKANCFTETSLTNNLVWYPRNTAIFGLTMSMARLTPGLRGQKRPNVAPLKPGRWPLLPLADWKKGRLPVAITTAGKSGLETRVAVEKVL